MATTRRDVELRINANDLSEKTLEQLLDTFEKLRKSQEALAKSGDGTQRSVRELKQDLTDLQAVAVELKSRAALVDQFLAIQKRAGDAATRVDAARAALQKFNAAQAEGTELTKKEQAEFTRLSREVQRAEKTLDSNTAKLKEFQATLAQMGEGDTNQTREALLRFSTDLGASLASAEQAIRSYDAALRANEKKERDAAEAKRASAKAAHELKVAQDALTSSVAFNTQGREALKAASNIEALSRDYDQLATSSRKAGDGIRQILDPSRQALASLDGLEGEIKRLNTQLNGLQGSPRLAEELKQLRGDYNALAVDAGKAAASLVDDIGSYRKVEQGVAALRTRLEAAQRSVQEFASQMAVTTEPSEKLSKDLGGAQARLKGLIGEFERESQALAGLRLRLREAGVDVNNLADAELRLQSVAAGVVESQRKIGAVAGRVDALTKATVSLKAAQDELEGGVAFNQLGRDALKAAKQVEALSRDYDALVLSSRKAGDGIRAIIDPSRQALASLDGLETQTRQLNEQLEKAASSNKLREEVRRLRSEYGSLATDSGKAAAALADQIGNYRQNEQAVGSLRVRVEAAQQAVQKFAGQMAVAAKPSDDLAKGLAQAKTQLASVVGEFERQSTALARMRAELREAGVDVGNLAAAEQRLENVARGVVTAQRALGTATVRVGDDAAKGAKGLNLFADSGRKALSSVQRLRGEVLSLASSYIGLFAAVNAAQAVVETAVTTEGILRRLELIEGSAAKAAAKFKELRAVADQIGVDFEKSAVGFTAIAIGAKEAGVSSERLDHFYVQLSKTVRGLSLDGERTSRVFTAVAQVFGKNKLTAEELSGQLGEHLPGILVVAQKALGQNAAEFTKNLEEGRLSAESLLVIFDEYARMTDKLSKNNKSAVDALTKFRNAMGDLKRAIADSGFLDVFVDLLNEAAEAIRSGRMKEAAEGFGNVLRIVANIARFLLENIDAVVKVFVGFMALNVGRYLFGLGRGFLSLVTAVRGSAAAMGLLRGAITLLTAHPLVALITLLAGLAVSTETGRAAIRALWQGLVELSGGLGELLSLDFAAFGQRVLTAMGRVIAAFRSAKTEAENLENTAKGRKPVGPGGAASSPTTASPQQQAAIEAENKRRAEAALTKKMVEGVEKDILEVRNAADREAARVTGDTQAEVRAQYENTQKKVDELFERFNKTRRDEDLVAAEDAQNKLNAEIARIVKAKQSQAQKAVDKKDRQGEIADMLEHAKQRAEAVKAGIRLENAELEQAYKEGLHSLREYHEKRLDQAKRSLDAEITEAREQIAILNREQPNDPKTAAKVTALEGEANRKGEEKKILERQYRMEADEAAKALRRQISALQQELDLLTGNERSAALAEIQQWYAEQLKVVNLLEGAERERALATLDTSKWIKTQLVDIQLMRKEADYLNQRAHSNIDKEVAEGTIGDLGAMVKRSEADAAYLKSLEEQRVMHILNGQVATDQYRKVQEEIDALRGKTDLLNQEVTAHAKNAATAFVQTLIETKSPEKALKAFGKSLGGALSKAFVDEAASAIVKFFKESGGFDLLKGLFSGIGGLFKSGHTGAVIGYSGAVDRRVSPFAFLGAERYHGGGLPGLRHDEVATILKRREEVLAPNDPRNVLNGGKSNSAPAPGGPMLVQLHPDALHMSLRDWLEREIAFAASKQ